MRDQLVHSHMHAHFLFNHGNKPDGKNAVTAQAEKASIGIGDFKSQQALPYPGQFFFHWPGRLASALNFHPSQG